MKSENLENIQASCTVSIAGEDIVGFWATSLRDFGFSREGPPPAKLWQYNCLKLLAFSSGHLTKPEKELPSAQALSRPRGSHTHRTVSERTVGTKHRRRSGAFWLKIEQGEFERGAGKDH